MQDSKALLESRKTNNLFAKFKNELQQAMTVGDNLINKLKALVKVGQKNTILNNHNAELGLLLINELPAYREDNWRYNKHVSYKSKRYKRIEQLLGADEWDNTDNYKLLEYFFGEEKAVYVRYAWEHTRFQMYQTGYLRRSFRSPYNKEMYLTNQVNLLIDLIPQAHNKTSDYSGGEYKENYAFYDLSVTEQMKYANLVSETNDSLFALWSAAIDMNNEAALQQAEDIIFNKDETGKVTRSLIKALLNSEKKEAWQLIEKLLLAAQRQEGLRQTILEALDETSIGALKYIIKVIIDNKLARLSSVVRAVDVWAGLGWESERETTVNKFLDKAYTYLENTDQIPEAINSGNNTDVYMALWAQGVYDVEESLPYLKQLLENANAEKRSLALQFANITGHYKLRMPLFYPSLSDHELQPLAIAVNAVYNALNLGENDKYYNHHYPELFNVLHETYKRVTVKEKTFESYIFSWLKIKFERKTILLSMLRLVNNQQRLEIVLQYFDEMDADAKRTLSRIILPNHAPHNYSTKKTEDRSVNEFQRGYAMLILKDRSEHETAFIALKDIRFTEAEAVIFPELFKRKAAGYRANLISLLLNQDDTIISYVIDNILQGDPEQRLAALDILLQLQKSKRLSTKIAEWASAFSERKSISQKEEILLSQLTGNATAKDISAKNGFGLFNPNNLSVIILPKVDAFSLYEKLCAQNKYGFSMPYNDIKKVFADLAALIEQHKNYEYEIEYYNNSREKVLLGNIFRKTKWKTQYENGREEFEYYPLHAEWEQWYIDSALQPQDLFIIQLSYMHNGRLKQLPDPSDFTPKNFLQRWQHANHFYEVPYALSLIHPFEQKNEFCIGAATRLFASLDDSLLKKKVNENYYPQYTRGWQEDEQLNLFLKNVTLWGIDDAQVKACWHLYNWRQYSGLRECIALYPPPLILFCRAYATGIISQDEMNRGIMLRDSISILSETKRNQHKNPEAYKKNFPFLKEMYDRVSNYILDIELKRGDSDTPLTSMAAGFETIYGINRFTEILAGLGKTPLYRGYFYSFSDKNHNKQELFSFLLKKCQPIPSDTLESFNENMQRIQTTESRLIEAAVYAPQWQKYVSSYLGWKGLDSAIWWMHAHTKTDTYNANNTETESEIAKYSSIDVQEFKNGAVDKDWFIKAYKEIGKQCWPIVYDAAKYISDGNGHRRARIYADVLLGELSFKEVTEKIKSKRDQDYVRIYGLAPLSKKNPEKDVLSRYEFLQQFKKESRQFGAQKQASEALALQIAMENLARNAGYPDPIRLTWAMETKQVQQILSKETQVQYDDVLIGLIIDEEGQAEVVAFKDEKQLKAIPAKYKKDSKVEELMEFRKTLREQFKRSRKGLEDAMVRGDIFSVSEVQNLFGHAVISKHLEKLVFVTDDVSKHGFYRSGKLIDANNHEHELLAHDNLRIAHCTDLFKTKQWPAYQHYAFDKQLQQPFKQIFRELYLPTQDELQEKTISRRYAGHQVQPKQTAALLRSRGWKADYEEGLQKVYHKEGFVAKIYAMSDWFSPAEVEAPTLETIEFHDLKTYKSIDFTTINERIFSEVMRDLDLVVSVAHVGGVDPEASHSSIEMRTVLLKETLRLFKINNVEIIGSHAKIKGALGEYSVHLGSAVVHQLAAGYLSILPVQSQHRGRLFLPFVDDDPKSAEVISKVLLLARDKDIQDPTILRQLNYEGITN